MEDRRRGSMRGAMWLAMFGAMLTILVGCANPNRGAAGGDALARASAALQAQRYDDAIRFADAVLDMYRTGPRAAEAHYLRGRALEDRPSESQEQARAALAAARNAYNASLSAGPDRGLEPLVRASLADVAFWQEDYATAADQGRRAATLLPSGTLRAGVLYRVGVAQQRLGQFDLADRTFAELRDREPTSELGRQAAERIGRRSFVVQLGTFAQAGGADQLVSQITSAGLVPLRVIDAQGRHVVSVGPLASYRDAQQVRARFQSQYPDALIIP